ncbi:MAG: SH3 domain-containing protein [Tepidisphaeraceae bacterium]
MKQAGDRKLLRALFTAAVVGVGGVVLAQAVEEVWVSRPELQIRQSKGPVGVVATARKGDKLTVLAREDNWLKVKFGEKEGYVMATSISARQIKGGQGVGDVLAGGSQSDAAQSGAAAKGLSEEAEGYARAKNMDPTIVDQMIARNSADTNEQWLAFAKEGNVGPERKK